MLLMEMPAIHADSYGKPPRREAGLNKTKALQGRSWGQELHSNKVKAEPEPSQRFPHAEPQNVQHSIKGVTKQAKHYNKRKH